MIAYLESPLPATNRVVGLVNRLIILMTQTNLPAVEHRRFNFWEEPGCDSFPAELRLILLSPVGKR